ncbi:MAG: hypothetical protein LDL07_03825 [Desulfarculus sp.]|nr:hypothetical protein [Desulfarculus sp.]
MESKGVKPSVRGNWFWCDPYGSSTNEAICRERMSRDRPYSPCRHCQRWLDSPPDGPVDRRRTQSIHG